MDKVQYAIGQVFTMPLIDITGSQDFEVGMTFAAGDAQLLSSIQGATNLTAEFAAFTSGSTEPISGETISGQSNSQTAVVIGVVLTSGSWGGTDAAGTIWVASVSGAWTGELVDNDTQSSTDDFTLTADFTASIGIKIIGNIVAFGLTIAEMTCRWGDILILDSATKVWIDDAYKFRTMGHANAFYQFNPFDSVRGGLTALPNAAADAAGGLVISDTGSLDMDLLNAAAVRLTAVRAAVLTDWIDGNRLDALLDLITAAGPTKAEMDTAHGLLSTHSAENVRTEMDSNSTQFAAIVGDTNELQVKLVGITLLNEWLGAIAGKQNADATALAEMKATGAGSGTYDPNTDSVEALRDRGDAAWTTGGGGSILDILNLQPVLPTSIDLANTATVRLGLILTNALDDLPSTAEITPGTISIDRKAIGGTSWSSIVSDGAMSEQAGMVFFDEVFDSGTGYAEGDSIRVTFKAVKITVSANDFEICDSNGIIFQTEIRQTMRGTNSANTTTPPTVGAIADQVWNEAQADHVAAGSFGITATEIAAIPTDAMRGTDNANTTTPPTVTEIQAELEENAASLLDTIRDELANGADGLTALKTAIDALNDLSAAQVNAEVDTALNTAIPGSPTANSINQRMVAVDALTEASGSGDLAAVKTAVDAIPTDAMRGTDSANTTTPPTVAEIQAEMEENGDSLLDTIRDELANGTDGLSALLTAISAIPTTAMRGTDNAASAAALATAQVDLDTLTDPLSELAQAAPSATPTPNNALMMLYMMARNRARTQTSGTDALEFYNNAGTMVFRKLITDSAGDYNEAEMVSGA